jgi:hypothetical protein
VILVLLRCHYTGFGSVVFGSTFVVETMCTRIYVLFVIKYDEQVWKWDSRNKEIRIDAQEMRTFKTLSR